MTYRACSKVFLFFVLILTLASCERRQTIVNALEEKEANEILVFLSSRDIYATKVQSVGTGGAGGQKIILWDVTVPRNQVTEAMALLNQSGLPRRRGQNLLKIFGEAGLVPSELSEKIRYQAGLAAQIGSTIRKIDGILDAEVQISFPEEDPLNPGKKKGDITASVYVKHSGVLDDPNTHLMTKIKRLVTASVTGLRYDNVTVISDRARYRDPFTAPTMLSDEDKEFLQLWTVIVAKESLFRFRILFFAFLVLILLLSLCLIWVVWKVHPLLKSYGGVRSIFRLSPLVEVSEEEEEAEEEEAEKPSEEA